MNTGTPGHAREVGALMYIGQPQYDAGVCAGALAKGDGVTSFVCVNHAIQQPTVGECCRGLTDGLGFDLGTSMLDSGTDPTEMKNKVLAYLLAPHETNDLLTLRPVSADATIAALKENTLAGQIYFGTLDLGEETLAAIKDGAIQ